MDLPSPTANCLLPVRNSRFALEVGPALEALEGLFLELGAVVGVGDVDQGAGALAQVLAVEIGDAVLGDDIVDVGARGDDAGAQAQIGRDPADVPAWLTEGRAMIGLPPSESDAPRTKSICPPTPEYWRVPIESAPTWPVRSTSMALLMAVTLGLRRMTAVSLT